jgi:uncharacterized protein (TIGR03790 family)
MLLHLFSLVIAIFAGAAQANAGELTAINLAIIVNDKDPQSIAVAEYYIKARRIPRENVIHTSFDPHQSSLSAAVFKRIKAQVDSAVPARVQAYALTWTKPYKVECMSITSAFALGFDNAYCAQGCKQTKRIPYYNASSRRPYDDFGIRPTMMLAGKDVTDVLRLIDRGLAADYSRPGGRAYLVSTSDKQRNVRSVEYPAIASGMRALMGIDIVKADYIEDKPDVFFYFTGVKSVQKIAANHYLPGAIADHLTSSGGVLFGHRQMSAIKWLQAGATGSYGTVTEPCNFRTKFPDPKIVMLQYLGGNTLIEAYWKSVAMPGQGIFIGEPLSSPFRGCRITRNQAGWPVFENRPLSGKLLRSDAKCGL